MTYSREELQTELSYRIWRKTGYRIPPEHVELGFVDGWAEGHSDEEAHWAVGKIGDGNVIRVGSKEEAEAAIAGIELVDPEGVHQGMYFIDPPPDDIEADS